MTCGWRSLLALAAGAAMPPAASAQQVRELGIQALVTTAEPTLVAAGLYGALRPSQHTRVALTLTGGEADGSLAGRAELAVHALAAPARRRGAQLYAGAGIAGVVGPADRGYIILLAGIEGTPGGRSGWVLEVGVGGGLRVSAGWHWRRPRSRTPGT
ncbi:MAG TPA: hypothetical protein VFS33_11160 [Gemmatimonadales bacterium]|nr:hypothetical protein [Gemmatimonadales bacterium]